MTTTLLVAPSPAGAQVLAFTDRSAFANFAQNTAHGFLCTNDLNQLPNGATSIVFTENFTAGAIVCGAGTLVGASVTNGHIESSTPFTLLLPVGTQSFSLDFGTPGSDVGYITLYQGATLIGTVSRPISGVANQFLGVVVYVGTGKPDRFDIGTQGGSAFTVDNITTSIPEPATILLVTSGLLALTAVARRRRAD